MREDDDHDRVPATTVTIAFNFFMNAAVGPDGRLQIRPPASKAGQSLTLMAERDVLVAVTSCSAPGANGGGARPLQVELTGAVATPPAGGSPVAASP
jgi:uncharacterized protein YcgI (DUF1989 family)